EQETRSDDDGVSKCIEVEVVGGVDVRNVLIGHRDQGNVGDVELFPLDEMEQQVERTLEYRQRKLVGLILLGTHHRQMIASRRSTVTGSQSSVIEILGARSGGDADLER